MTRRACSPYPRWLRASSGLVLGGVVGAVLGMLVGGTVAAVELEKMAKSEPSNFAKPFYVAAGLTAFGAIAMETGYAVQPTCASR